MTNLEKYWHKSFWELQLANYSGARTFTFSYNNLNYKKSKFLYEPTYDLIKDSYLKTHVIIGN